MTIPKIVTTVHYSTYCLPQPCPQQIQLNRGDPHFLLTSRVFGGGQWLVELGGQYCQCHDCCDYSLIVVLSPRACQLAGVTTYTLCRCLCCIALRCAFGLSSSSWYMKQNVEPSSKQSENALESCKYLFEITVVESAVWWDLNNLGTRLHYPTT